MNRNIKLLIAAHKPYRFPTDEVYLPVHVGAAGKPTLPGCVRDDTGDNISTKNANYCELTGLYWAWKNLDADYIGLAHYRRHFSTGKRFGDKWERILTGAELEQQLADCDILLPRSRNYWIETNYSQYAHAHHAVDLDTARAVILERCPDYVSAFDAIMKRTTGHRFNMFVMKRGKFDAYCAWLFDILFEVEKRLDISAYSANDARVFGFLSERLLDVWLERNGYAYRELPWVFLERENWLRKGSAFVMRKLRAKKGGRA